MRKKILRLIYSNFKNVRFIHIPTLSPSSISDFFRLLNEVAPACVNLSNPYLDASELRVSLSTDVILQENNTGRQHKFKREMVPDPIILMSLL